MSIDVLNSSCSLFHYTFRGNSTPFYKVFEIPQNETLVSVEGRGFSKQNIQVEAWKKSPNVQYSLFLNKRPEAKYLVASHIFSSQQRAVWTFNTDGTHKTILVTTLLHISCQYCRIIMTEKSNKASFANYNSKSSKDPNFNYKQPRYDFKAEANTSSQNKNVKIEVKSHNTRQFDVYKKTPNVQYSLFLNREPDPKYLIGRHTFNKNEISSWTVKTNGSHKTSIASKIVPSK